MNSRAHNEKGFTILELIVVFGIVTILASLSAINVKNIREKVYDAEFLAAKHDIWVALQIGSYYFEEKNATNVKSTGVLKAGPITTIKAQRLLPGINEIPENIEVTASWAPRDSNCNNMCFIRSVYVKHCKTLRYSLSEYYVWEENELHDGTLHALFWNGAQPCT